MESFVRGRIRGVKGKFKRNGNWMDIWLMLFWNLLFLNKGRKKWEDGNRYVEEEVKVIFIVFRLEFLERRFFYRVFIWVNMRRSMKSRN